MERPGEPIPTPACTRRSFISAATAAAGAALAGGVVARTARASPVARTPAADGWYVPADTVRHERTWMAWPARRDIWGSLLPGARDDVARIAKTIVKYEPVSMVTRPREASDAARACGPGVEIVQLTNDDLWMRDMGPVFLVDGRGGLAGLDLNFNGWGHTQVHANDHRIAREILELLNVPRFDAPFVSEGGALEPDGNGTVMATESSIINPNRNPGRTKARLAADICAYLGAREVLWVPGLAHHDITDDHIDGLARFVHPGTIVVDQPADPDATDPWARSERQALRILSGDTDSHGRQLDCLISRESQQIPPGQDPNTFVNVYVNWYVCNDAVLVPAFDDPHADAAAHRLIAALYPDRNVEQLRIDTIAAGGGGIHCTTQQQPATPPHSRSSSQSTTPL
jgi:agmatine deiminase